ncbi:MAG: hypothetical protein GY748_10010, partial [Planctomycetaceae bacterium]|nr:hypothetical protein [Planctomycetaceae bacterium]
MADHPTKQDLMLAILSLDSYMRGPTLKAAMRDLDTNVGDWEVDAVASEKLPDSSSSGFEAVSYTSGDDTIISYRGTDFDFSTWDGVQEFLKDVGNGWLSSFGILGDSFEFAGEEATTFQPKWANEFYKIVTGREAYEDGEEGAPGEVILTGHSLGGSLAGYVGSQSGDETVLFNEIPFFGLAVGEWLQRVEDITNKNLQRLAAATSLSELEAIADDLDPIPSIPSIDQIHAFRTTGEIAGLTRLLGPFIQLGVDAIKETVPGRLAAALNDALGGFLGDENQSIQDQIIEKTTGIINGAIDSAVTFLAGVYAYSIEETELSTYDGISFNPLDNLTRSVDFHSQALSIILTYGELNKHTKWQELGKEGWLDIIDANQLIRSLYDEINADSVVPSELLGYYTNSAKMMSALAYSALDSGNLIFGDTGIRAMFDDADELGTVFASGNVNSFFNKEIVGAFKNDDGTPEVFSTSVSQLISDVLVQYSGALALNEVEKSVAAGAVKDVDATEGILNMSPDGNVLALDLSSILWEDVLNTGKNSSYGPLQPRYRDEYIEKYYLEQNVTGFLDWLFYNTDNTRDLLDSITEMTWEVPELDPVTSRDGSAVERRRSDLLDRFHMRAFEDIYEVKMSDRSYNVEEQAGKDVHIDIYSGTDEDDSVTGTMGNDIIFGLGGDDIIIQRGGRDAVITGEGDDLIIDRINFDPVKSPDPSIVERDDLFVGGRFEGSFYTHFLDWLGGDQGATVQYSIEDVKTGEFLNKGLEITNIEKTVFGKKDATLFSFTNLNNGKAETDLLVGIEKIVLTERYEYIDAGASVFEIQPLFIDMGGFAPGTVTKDDWDEISYKSLSHGIVSVNGTTRALSEQHGPIVKTFAGAISEISQIIPYALGVAPDVLALGSHADNDPLRVIGAERIEGTSHDDTLWFGEIGYLNALFGGWTADDYAPKIGEIDGGGGNDWIVHRGADFVEAGGGIPEEMGGAADGTSIAAEEMRLTIKGGAGDDRLIAVDGTGAILVGGDGTDFLFNTTFKGQLYGGKLDAQGSDDTDIFWYWPSTFIMDAQPNDILQMFGWPLLGGSNSVAGIYAGDGSLAIDWLNWTVFYGATKSGQLLVVNAVAAALGIGARDGDPFPAGTMVVEDYDSTPAWQGKLRQQAETPARERAFCRMAEQGYMNIGWKDAEWGRPAAGDLGLTFRIAANR